MEVESRLVPTSDAVDEIPVSQVVNCDSADIGEVEKRVNRKTFLQAPLEHKEHAESCGTISDLENNSDAAAETITSERDDTLELSTSSSKAPDEKFSFDCQTPCENIFDPFAPGPEEAPCAPKKATRGTEVSSRRQLNLGFGDYPVRSLSYKFDDAEEDDCVLQELFKIFLDLIVSHQGLKKTAKNLMVSSSPESFKTPTSAPLLTGTADTCPDAPFRPSLKGGRLSPSICRKLDFESMSFQDF